jgi:hypothetical protein
MFSATVSLVAVISMIEEPDSSALVASTSTLVPTARRASAVSRTKRDASSLALSWVVTPSFRDLTAPIRSLTAPTSISRS